MVCAQDYLLPTYPSSVLSLCYESSNMLFSTVLFYQPEFR